LTLQTYYR